MLTKIIPEEKIIKAKDLINDAEHVAVIGHMSPDGDAVGSALALYHFLHTMDKQTTIIFPDSIPAFLTWLPGAGNALNYEKDEHKPVIEKLLQTVDLIICVDFNEPKRIGKLYPLLASATAKKILIDHHPRLDDFTQLTISHPEIVATAELVFRLICRMGYFSNLNHYCAEAIYTGMMTDTGGFTFNSNHPEIYHIIFELLKKGIDKDKIYNNVYNVYSEQRMRLMGYLLSDKMKIYPQYRTAIISLSLAEQKKYSFQKGDAEGFVNIPLSIKGIVFSIFIKEEKDKINISFRSQGNFPVNNFAMKHFEGGGHKNAAGGESVASLEEIHTQMEKLLPLYKNELNE